VKAEATENPERQNSGFSVSVNPVPFARKGKGTVLQKFRLLEKESLGKSLVCSFDHPLFIVHNDFDRRGSLNRNLPDPSNIKQ